MPSLDAFAKTKLAALEARHLKRTLAETTRADGLWVERGGRRMLSFSCNDYLNLTHHPAVKHAAVEATKKYGVGAGASRLVTGNHPLFGELERRLAQLKGTEAACVFGSGYLANAGIVPAVASKGDLLLVDELSHSCLWAGARLSWARVEVFRHNDVAHAEEILRFHRVAHRHALIVTDGVFSMDGDLAPLKALSTLAQAYDTWLMSDDAHGLGVLGGGRGSAHATGASVDLQMGTLSKALGSYGGYVCASAAVIDLLKTRARTLIYSTGVPPASVAAALAALDIVENDTELTARPLAKAQSFTRICNLPPAASQIVPVVLGDPLAALEASQILEREGFLVTPIRPPTVPEGTARLRLAFTAGHPDDEVARLATIIRERILA
ncbi:MAG: 8-amino-7-oxononanoate synthase [Alphaproteobacteria bacterium]|nr:8-amino-7-oxononanoate synthase [Alphaproteobacteria bacterium]MDE2110466.1 8-amino-7-oxononanoate synthase [Alphaproteobacteria bacterium]MDE2493217.1 8-amino-7-oxononanoate synthase [Alphaproteobacteria bacterium]